MTPGPPSDMVEPLKSSLLVHGVAVALLAGTQLTPPAPLPMGGTPREPVSVSLATNDGQPAVSPTSPELPSGFVPPTEPDMSDVVTLLTCRSQSSAFALPSAPEPLPPSKADDGSVAMPRGNPQTRRSDGTTAAGGGSRGGNRASAWMPPRALHCPAPSFPQSARRDKASGVTLVRLEIDAEGAVVSARLTQSAGRPDFDTAALEVVRAWQFHPARRGGTPVPCSVEVPIRFALDA